MVDEPKFDQRGQAVHGPQTIIKGGARDILSGAFSGNVYINSSGATVPLLIPHQVPSPPSDFTGRDAKLKELEDELNSGINIVGLRGIGGVGKTALAFKLVERLRDRYPDGQLFINMIGANGQPLPPAEAMAQVIRSYAPTFPLPKSEAEIGNHYRSLLYGKRALLLLDNAASGEQIMQLLPTKDCTVLVTSRYNFVLPGMPEMLPLDVMKPPEASKLLLKICPRIGSNEEELAKNEEELAKLCGYLPLALRAAASFLAVHRDKKLEKYMEELRSERTRLKKISKEGVDLDVDSSFSLSYSCLSKETASVFSQLSVFPSNFDAAAEEFVCQDDGHWHLSKLVRCSLVEYQPAGKECEDRYHLHDLVRFFAASRLEAEEKAQAQWRHATYYLTVLFEANYCYNDYKDGILKGLRIFNYDEMNILIAHDYAHEEAAGKLKENSRELALRLLCSYPYTGGRIFAHRLHPEKHSKFLEDALSAASQLKRKNTCSCINIRKCSYFGNLGLVYAYLGDTGRAIESHKKQLGIARQNMYEREERDAIYNIGRIYADIGEIHRALKWLNKATSAYKNAKDYRGELKSLIAQGIIYRYLGKVDGAYNSAIKCHEKALEISQKNGYKKGVAYALNNLGNDLVDKNEIEKALEKYKSALVIDKEIYYIQGQVADLGNIGYAYAAKGELNKATENLEESIKLAKRIMDLSGEAKAESMMGMVCEIEENYKGAKEHYVKALEIVENIKFRRREGQAHINLGNVYAAEGDYSNAKIEYENAINIANKIRDRKGIAKCKAMMGKVCEKSGNYDNAIEHYEESLKIVREIKYHRREGYALENLGDAYRAEGYQKRNYKKACRYYKKALGIYREICDTRKEECILCKIRQVSTGLIKTL